MAKTTYKQQSRNPWILLILILAGGLAGNIVAHLLPNSLGVLKAVTTIGLTPTTLDLKFLKITLGLTMDAGIMTVIGLLLGYVMYRKI
jgi:hypothetical protein